MADDPISKAMKELDDATEAAHKAYDTSKQDAAAKRVRDKAIEAAQRKYDAAVRRYT